MKRLHVLGVCVAFACSGPASATMLDSNWTESMFSANPMGGGHTGLAWAPDGSDRLFVLEKGGRVRLMSGALTTGTATWTTFATMSPIFTDSECGLIGIAFDPDFANNQLVYFFVTASNTEQQILRYSAAGPTGSDRTVIVPGLPTVGANHDGGGIGFGADGKLYWSVGDQGNRTGVDDDLTTLAAKVGRANRDGSLPFNNPFDDGGGPNNDYIFARGMRNPFTMKFQPSTGLMWLNVVGDGYEQVFVVRRGDHGGYDNFENSQPAPTPTQKYITPTLVYPTSTSSIVFNITDADRSGGVATFTTQGSHRLRVGSNVGILNVPDASFNGADQFVTAVLGNNQFSVAQAGPTSLNQVGGTVSTLIQGRCLTGGEFYDASGAPAAYRGNFFYGDCVSGRIMRARVDDNSDRVTGTTHWASGIGGQVDIALGPDGALWYTGGGSNTIYRATYNATGQALIVANRNLRADEDGLVATTLRLAIAPPGDVQVQVARTGGSDEAFVVTPATHTFTTANWMQPQVVRLQTLGDDDGDDEQAIFTVSSNGLTSENVTVHILDTGVGPDAVFSDGFED